MKISSTLVSGILVILGYVLVRCSESSSRNWLKFLFFVGSAFLAAGLGLIIYAVFCLGAAGGQ